MTNLSAMLEKESSSDGEELDIASLGMTVATADSVKQKKQSKRGTKKGGKKNGESWASLGASLSDLLERNNDSGSSLEYSDQEAMTCVTQDSREQSSSSLMKRSKRGGRKRDQKNSDDEGDKYVARTRTVSLED
jgi:hypothetical protein